MTGDPKDTDKINTGGGAYIGGNVSTGGDFVGRDKVTTAGDRGVAVGGNVTGSTIVTGDGNVANTQQGISLEEFRSLLADIRGLARQADLEERKARTIEADVIAVEEESKESKPDGNFIVNRLEGIIKVLKAAGNLTDAGKKLFPLAEKALEWGVGLFV